MENSNLKAENAHLTQLLEQAGLEAQARDVAERIQGVLIGEIHHRMKNMLTMVTAIVRQSMRTATSLEDAQSAIIVRLQAMAKAHDLLLKADSTSTSLRDVIQGAVQQHDTAEGRIAITGTDIRIMSQAIQPLMLALNELCTNAIKYGALSNLAGRVAIGWTADADTLTLRWVESGGPVVAPPARKSFGTRLIADALPRQLGGTARLAFAPPGVIFELAIPLDRLVPAPAEIPTEKESVDG